MLRRPMKSAAQLEQRLEDQSILPARATVVKHASGIRSALPKERAAVATVRSSDHRWTTFPQLRTMLGLRKAADDDRETDGQR
jgi:hypothetical protein